MGDGARRVLVKNLNNHTEIADQCFVAERFFDRLIGLIGRSGLRPGEGMLFPNCNNIHMWFMRIPIDVVFLRRERRTDGRDAMIVSSVHRSIRPWRVLPLWDFAAIETLELPEGTIERAKIQKGDELCINSL